jgi:hypothetical protein
MFPSRLAIIHKFLWSRVVMNRLAKRLAGLIVAAAAVIGPHHHAMAAGGQLSMGLEGFYDQYRENSLGVKDNSPYGSITAGYTYSGNDQWFGAIEGRGSYGQDNYSSPSGKSSGANQWEAELRLRVGYYFEELGGTLAPYVGIGGRFFYDQGNGVVTTIGDIGYDRVIDQLYIPVGAGWTFHSGDWTIVPVAEYDQLIYGRVFSELSEDPGYPDAVNNQHEGWGLRGELMFGHEIWGNQWQIGPFVRFWDINQSSTEHYPDGGYAYEPHNTRLQTGLAVRLLF